MRSSTTHRAVLAAATACAVGVGVITAVTAQAAPAARTIRLFEHDTQPAASIDLGDPGPGLGDLFDFAGDLFDHQGGTRLGRARGNCTTVSGDAATPGDLHCTTVFVLADGQITTDALFDSTALFSGTTLPFAVTGGTGRYRDAQGEGTAQVPDVPGQTDVNFVLTLRPGA